MVCKDQGHQHGGDEGDQGYQQLNFPGCTEIMTVRGIWNLYNVYNFYYIARLRYI